MLNTIINYITLFASLVAGISLLLYLPRLYAWFFSAKEQAVLKNERKNKIALIIPARNESTVIGQLLDSIDKQTYSKEDFDFYVIVKDPNDPTIQMVEDAGGIAHALPTQTCKGDALDYTLQRILADKPGYYNAYLIIDADCRMDEKCLEEFNNALASGRQIIQAKKIVKNYYMNKKMPISACCNGIIWTIIDELGNRFKSDKGITNMTIGTGIMLRSDVVEQIGGWPYRQTLTEDIELMYDCVVKNFSTFYYSHAKIYVEEADNLRDTNKRRNRWLNGVINSKRCYAKKLKELPRTNKTIANIYYTCALEPVYAYIGSLAIYAAIMATSAIPFFFVGGPWIRCLILAGGALGIIYFSFLILTAFCMVVDRQYMKLGFFKRIVVFFVHPVFYMGYIPIIAKHLITRGNAEWKVIGRVDFS